MKYLTLTLLLLTLILSTNSYAQDSLSKRIAEAEYKFQHMTMQVNVMYGMIRELYIKEYGEKAYEDLVFNKGETVKVKSGDNAGSKEFEIKK